MLSLQSLSLSGSKLPWVSIVGVIVVSVLIVLAIAMMVKLTIRKDWI